MASLVELKYNPYIPNLSILLDGRQPSDFSRLVQYSDEDLWLWYWYILDAIYSEVRNDFAISFTGTLQDAQIMENVCKQHKFCCGFRAKDFIISEILQTRMKKLNQFIKKSGNITYAKTVIDAVFLVPPQMQEYLEDISGLDVNNLFCAVRVSTMGLRSNYEETENSFLFLITNAEMVGTERLKQFNTKKPVFVLVIGNSEEIIKVTDNAWYFGTTPDELINTIFSCLLQIPLLIAFRRCVKSIQQKSCSEDFYKIYATEPAININLSNKIEVGKSTKITVTLDPPVGELPDLVYKVTNQNIASCNGLYIYGNQEGISNLEVYKQGDKKPFFIEEIRVFKRNRITKIILSDDELILGMGDTIKINYDYFPQNADNVQSITWKSSDEGIVKVEGDGSIAAMGEGSCRIICTVENISAQCLCTVKPYLKEITLDFDLDGGIMTLEPMEEVILKITTFPCDCIDDSLIVISSNNDAVNVINNTLYAKKKGEATITVKNSNGRISRNFKVVVTERKTGFFANIFNKRKE